MKNLAIRLATAAIAIPIILALLYLLPWWAFGALAAAAAVVAAIEFFGLTHPGDRRSQIAGVLLTGAVFALLVTSNFGRQHPVRVLFGILAVVPAALLCTLFRPGDQSSALTRMSALALGPLYVGPALGAMAALRRSHPPGMDRVGAGLVVLTLMIAWLGDTGGYFAGRNLGGPKLYPAVSPNKTWTGAFGGLLGSATGALLAHFWFLRELPLARGLAVALAAGAVGQAGDLCESLMKRSAGVKDSGGIIPGHGGILDRIDAMMFVAIVLLVAVRSGWLVLS